MKYTLVGNEDGEANLTVYVEGRPPLAAHSSHPNYAEIIKGVLADDESVYDLFDVSLTAASKLERLSERIIVANGRLYIDGEEVHDALAEQIVSFVKEDVEDWKPLVAFYENILANPNQHSREQSYRWLTAAKLTITEDGMIVGYKGVKTTEDPTVFLSTTAGNAISDGEVFNNSYIPNKLGTVVEMPRGEVVHDPSSACSVGLHIGTYSFAKTYGNAMLEVHVNPRDVVSVPNGEPGKMRACRYKVIKVIDSPYQTAVKPAEQPTKPAKTAVNGDKQRPVKVGDVYQDTDKRRVGRKFKVTGFEDGGLTAVGKSMPLNLTRKIAVSRLLSRKYKLTKRGK